MHSDSEATRDMQETLRRQKPRGVWAKLLDVLLTLTEGHGALVSHAERPWASATFSGTRHRASIVFEGPDAVQASDMFIALLPEHEFSIPGQLVADAAIVEVRTQMLPEPHCVIDVELLLLDDG